MVVAFYFRLHLAYFPRPVVAIFARPEHRKHMTEFFRYNCYSKAINFGGGRAGGGGGGEGGAKLLAEALHSLP